MSKKDEIIYPLVVEDIQTVAEESFGRELSTEEVKKIIDPIGDMIPWYDIIENCIILYLGLETVDIEID
jgi:hypothetical protein